MYSNYNNKNCVPLRASKVPNNLIPMSNNLIPGSNNLIPMSTGGPTNLSTPRCRTVGGLDKIGTFTNYDNAYKDQTPIVINAPFKFSDDHPYNDNLKTHNKQIIRQQKLLISDRKKTITTDPPEKFSVNVNKTFKNIRSVRLIQVGVTWTPPASDVPRDAYVYFPDFDHSEQTADGKNYHGYFPLVQGDAGTPVLFNFNFNNNYESDFKQLNVLPSKLRVEVFKEDPATNEWILFEELDNFIVEIQVNYVDPVADKDKDVGK